MIYRLFTVLVVLTVCAAIPLSEIYHNLEVKQNEIKMHQMLDFIAKNVPEGIEAPQPKIAEYETFKADKMANFINDGSGKLQFRQFRRMKLSDVLAHHKTGI